MDGRGSSVTPASSRHSRESGNPHLAIATGWGWPGLAGCGVSPSPNPLPLGEGFSWLAPIPVRLTIIPHLPSAIPSTHTVIPHTPPSFRRRPESRTPVCPGVSRGPGVDSRFRGNDGRGAGMAVGGGNDEPGAGLWRRTPPILNSQFLILNSYSSSGSSSGSGWGPP